MYCRTIKDFHCRCQKREL